MKKIKLFACLTLLGLGLTGVFASPIESNAAEATTPPSEAVTLAAEGETATSKSKNLLDISSNNFTPGLYLSYTSGVASEDSDYYWTSNYVSIPDVRSSQAISINFTPGYYEYPDYDFVICFYDADKNYVSGHHLPSGNPYQLTFNINPNIKYFRTTLAFDTIAEAQGYEFMYNLGCALYLPYEPYGSSASTPTAAEIDAYMNANAAETQFDLYKTLMYTTAWKVDQNKNGDISAASNDMGEAVYSDHDLPSQIDFKAGQVYVISGWVFNSRNASDLGNKSFYEYTSNLFDHIYRAFDSTDLYTFIKNNSSYANLSNENLYYDLDKAEYQDESKWDSRISPAIVDNFRSKLASISSDWDFVLECQPTHIIVPKNDFSVVLDGENYKNYPGSHLYIKEATTISPDYKAPEIGGTVHLSVNVDSQASVDEILSHVTAIDETDGQVPVTLVSSTYEPGVMQVGDYIIKVSAKDSASNTATADVTVHRFDSTAPVISGKDSYDLNYNHDITLQKVLDGLTITDNVDSNLSLEVVSDSFTGHEHELGNYQIVVETKDLSNNNSANKTISLAVKNKGTAVITAPTEITVTISQPLTLDQLKERISVEDGYDGTITNYEIEGFDKYTSTSGVVGTNSIHISYTNSGANTVGATITIKKVDDKAPGIYFDSGYFVLLSQGQEFTLQQFKVQAASVLMISPEEIESIEGEFDTNTAGEYEMKVKLASGTTETFNVIVGKNKTIDNQFHFKDLFTKFFWKASYSSFLANMTNPAGWNWMNWTLVGIAGLLVLAVVGGVLFNKKKKNG